MTWHLLLQQCHLHLFSRAVLTKYNKLGSLKQLKYILSQFWRTEVQNKGVDWAVLPLKDLEEYLFLSLPVLEEKVILQIFLGFRHHLSNPCLCIYITFSPCILLLCLNFPFLFFIFNFYCYSITVLCLFSPSLHPTPAEPTSLPHLHPPPWFCPWVLYSSSCNPLFPLSPPPAIVRLFLTSMSLVIFTQWNSTQQRERRSLYPLQQHGWNWRALC